MPLVLASRCALPASAVALLLFLRPCLAVQTALRPLTGPAKAAVRPTDFCSALSYSGSYYTTDIQVGTPGQTFSVVVDTGVKLFVVPSCACQPPSTCNSAERCFTGSNISSTFSISESGPKGPKNVHLLVASGSVDAVVADDVVDVAGVRASMNGSLLLMTSGPLAGADTGIDGVLGLGLSAFSSGGSKPWEQAAVGGAYSGIDGYGLLEGLPLVGLEIDANSNTSGGGTAAGAVGMPIYTAEQEAAILSKAADDRTKNAISEPKSFLEMAGIKRFSVCFNDGAPGALRLNTPEAHNKHGSIGKLHWGLGFHGVSVGSETASVSFCSPGKKSREQDTPCAAIPDTGTSLIMAPAEHLDPLMESICEGWPRCAQNYSMVQKAAKDARKVLLSKYGVDPWKVEAPKKSEILELLLEDCSSWLPSTDAKHYVPAERAHALDELPALHLHVAGEGGTRQSLRLPGWSYVLESTVDGKKTCSLALTSHDRDGAYNYKTADNGPIWILGMPLFYEFNIGFDTKAKPPAISFTSLDEQPCKQCRNGAAQPNSGVGPVSLVASAAEQAARTETPAWRRLRQRPTELRFPSHVGGPL